MKRAALFLVLPFLLTACGGDAQSAPDFDGEPAPALMDSELPIESEAETAPAVVAATPEPARVAPTPPPSASSVLPETPLAPVMEREVEVEVPVPGPEPLAPTVAIPSGTLIPAAMVSALSTRTNVAGDRFQARVSEEILASDGMVLIPEGAFLEGRVAEARRSGSAEEEALLLLTFDALMIRGERFPIEAMVTDVDVDASAQASGARSAATVATGAAAGAIVGRILGRDSRSTVGGAVVGAIAGAGVALTTRDGHAEIREGTSLVVRLEAPAVLLAP
ncbi:MAG: hypothetical protein WD056_00880 [Gemmatimonadota bacterium]